MREKKVIHKSTRTRGCLAFGFCERRSRRPLRWKVYMCVYVYVCVCVLSLFTSTTVWTADRVSAYVSVYVYSLCLKKTLGEGEREYKETNNLGKQRAPAERVVLAVRGGEKSRECVSVRVRETESKETPYTHDIYI